MLQNFFYHVFKMAAVFFQRSETFADRDTADADILRCNQLIFVKQGDLHTASPNVNDRRRVLDDRLKLICHGSDRLIVHKPLL